MPEESKCFGQYKRMGDTIVQLRGQACSGLIGTAKRCGRPAQTRQDRIERLERALARSIREELRGGTIRMARTFKRGDHVEWNSEAGVVTGVIFKKVVSDVRFKGYMHHASKKEPQYLIKSDKTDHVANHKGSALKLVKTRTR
jgi:hypothetical protein